MNCEVCGRKIVGPARRVVIEGAVMSVCENCARFGVTPKTWSRIPRKPPVKAMPVSPTVAKSKRRIPAGSDLELVEGYGRLIRESREKMGLSQEDLAKMLKEKLSVIKRIEAERMEPPRQLASKIEKVLKITLYVPASSMGGVSTSKGGRELTLGDVVRLRK